MQNTSDESTDDRNFKNPVWYLREIANNTSGASSKYINVDDVDTVPFVITYTDTTTETLNVIVSKEEEEDAK